MTRTTITEALAELKTIQKRIQKKREFVTNNIARQDGVRDPHLGDGGTRKLNEEALQAVSDLERRTVDIRTAILKSNLETEVTVGSWTRTVQHWLTWRREVIDRKRKFFNDLDSRINQLKDSITKQGLRYVQGEEQARDDKDVVFQVDPLRVQKAREDIEETFGELDGKLSLMNATTEIEY